MLIITEAYYCYQEHSDFSPTVFYKVKSVCNRIIWESHWEVPRDETTDYIQFYYQPYALI